MAWKNVQYENGKYKTSSGGGGGASSLTDLDDTNISSPSNGQVLKYNSTNSKWENANESGGGGTVTDVEVNGTSVVNQGVAQITVPDDLSDLSDVALSSLQDHQPLRYNATSQKWVNGADSYPPIIYSDTERVVGAWRDGKPLYQKTINFGALPDAAEKFVAHNISNLDKITKLFGITSNSSGGTFPLPFVNIETSPGYQIVLRATASDIVVRTGSDRTAFTNTFITLQYTKTTDTAGSGAWTTEGTPTHHYSTTEQVVGTWIDGKPVYEQSLTFNSPAYNWSKNDHNIANIKRIIESQVTLVNGSSKFTPYYHNAGDFVGAIVNEEGLYISSGQSIDEAIVTLRYTKTTD